MSQLVGLVYYADDPHQRVFRKVLPSPGEPDSVLDDPKHVTDGVDPARPVVMRKVLASSPAAAAGFSGTPWTPATDPLPPPQLNDYVTPPDQVAAILAQLTVGPGDVFYDLGSGDGGFLIAAARLGARAIGYEIDLARNVTARAAAALAGVPIEVREVTAIGADLSDATAVVDSIGGVAATTKLPAAVRLFTLPSEGIA